MVEVDVRKAEKKEGDYVANGMEEEEEEEGEGEVRLEKMEDDTHYAI